MLVRLGGDEFAILSTLAPTDDGRQIATAILDRIAEPFVIDGARLLVSASAGVAERDDGARIADLLRRADVAMYAAKDAHARVAVYDPELDHLNRLRFEMIHDLDAALNQRQFVLHYQPKIDVASGATFGAEALVRWEHPTRGLLYPDAFLPVVEQNGLMNAVTWFVLQEAVRQLVIWKEDGLDISIAVNLSASDLLDDSLADRIEALLDEYPLPAGALELEITESVIMLDPERARTVLEALRRLGLRIAIDDYGTGYCALAYLQDLPVDELKLDRSFAARVSHGCAQCRDRPLDDRARPRPRPAGRRRRRRGPADPRRRRELRLRLRAGLLLQPSRPGGRIRRSSPPRGVRARCPSLPPCLLAEGVSTCPLAGSASSRREHPTTVSKPRLVR